MDLTDNFLKIPEGTGYLQDGSFIVPIHPVGKSGVSIFTTTYIDNVKYFIANHPNKAKNHISFLEYLEKNDLKFKRYTHSDISFFISQPEKTKAIESRYN